MRIGIEAQRLFRPGKHGMEKVAVELIKNLQIIDKDNEYFIFVKPNHDKSCITSTENFHIVEIPSGIYPIWEQYKLAKIANAYKCDLLHCTSNTAPLFGKIPLVITLHDIIYMEHSLKDLLFSNASTYQKFGNLYRRLIVPFVVKRCQRIITVSNYERENITFFFKLKDNRIQTIYNGVNERYNTQISEEALTIFEANYKLPMYYILHISNKDPRKNTKRVLLAYKSFIKATGAKYKLVMLGVNDDNLKIMLAEVKALDLYKNIVLIGYVPDEDLPTIYNLAALFLFPSLREGFGIPIIEAMACSVPVITSNTSSMPEIAGDAAHLINPNKTEEITNGIIKILSDVKYKDELIKNGLKRYKLFKWESMAYQVLDVYKQVSKNIKTKKVSFN
jgi:glycosyltransferase involved in cell wall biosynthesis